MKERIITEICVDSVESALAAEKGGASRIELCSNLTIGGTTPSLAMIELVKKHTNIDINVMIRPRGGDFSYDLFEYEIMKRDIELVKKHGINSIVIGGLKPNGEIDINMMKELIDIARPLSVTFHRAFDMVKNPFDALEELISLGVDRILTSGQEETAMNGMDLIRKLVNIADNRIVIMAGAGVNRENVKAIVEGTGVKEIHLSAKKRTISNVEYGKKELNIGHNSSQNEYDRYFTCEETVRDVIKTLDSLLEE